MTLDPIGIVHSCFGGKFGVPRQPGLCPSAWGRLVFHDAYRSPEVRPPRLGGNRRVGVFASRSTFRPNGLGLSLVRLEGIDTSTADGPVLLLGGVDLLDGTPVYDLKPYLPYAESIPEAAAGFASDEIPRLKVELADEAVKRFSSLPQRAQAVIREALALDPRPAIQTEDPDRVFGALLCGHDVRFIISGDVCRILEIE